MPDNKKFNSPMDLDHIEEKMILPEGVTEKSLRGPGKVFPGMLLGNWINANPNTRGIVKINLGITGGTFTVHPYGACHPTPCDWGSRPAITYAANVESQLPVAFTAFFPQGFKDTIVAGRIEHGMLRVETFNDFKDGSNRSDYYTCELFRRG